jgi:hypothetical protein
LTLWVLMLEEDKKSACASSYKMWLINKVKTMVPVALLLSLSPFFRWFVYRLSSISLQRCSEPQKYIRDTAKEEEETTKRWYTQTLIYRQQSSFFFFLLACDVGKRASSLFKSGPFGAVIIIRKPSFPSSLWPMVGEFTPLSLSGGLSHSYRSVNKTQL